MKNILSLYDPELIAQVYDELQQDYGPVFEAFSKDRIATLIIDNLEVDTNV